MWFANNSQKKKLNQQNVYLFNDLYIKGYVTLACTVLEPCAQASATRNVNSHALRINREGEL